MGETNGSTSLPLSSLLCHETEACLNEEGGREGEEENDDDDENTYAKSLCEPGYSWEEEDEYVRGLIQRETHHLRSEIDSASRGGDCSVDDVRWLKSARLDAVQWILNRRALLGFHHHTAYLSITYFDRFTSIRSIDEQKPWAIRLLSMACLSLAAKMEERSFPRLSDFSAEDYVFEDRVIMRMELLVLSTLDWKMDSITAFAYLKSFISKVYSEPVPRGLVSRVVDLLMAITKEINLMDYRPSAIAASAVLVACDCRLTSNELETKLGLISSCVCLDNESVYSCHNLMQEIEKEKHRTPRSVVSETLAKTSNGALECSSVGLECGSKRRLSFNDPDSICPEKKICRS